MFDTISTYGFYLSLSVLHEIYDRKKNDRVLMAGIFGESANTDLLVVRRIQFVVVVSVVIFSIILIYFSFFTKFSDGHGGNAASKTLSQGKEYFMIHMEIYDYSCSLFPTPA